MKSLAFIVVGLTLGVLLTFVLFKSGFQISFNKPGTTPVPNASDLPISAASSTPTTTPATKTKIQAGGKLVFVKYQLEVPEGWSSNKTSSYADQETLTLTSGGYEIVINEGASGGMVCMYPGDPESEIIFQTDYKYFKQLTTADGTLLRRGGDAESSLAFTVCSKGEENYQAPTEYGHISVKFPANPTSVKITEVDEILSSLKKI